MKHLLQKTVLILAVLLITITSARATIYWSGTIELNGGTVINDDIFLIGDLVTIKIPAGESVTINGTISSDQSSIRKSLIIERKGSGEAPPTLRLTSPHNSFIGYTDVNGVYLILENGGNIVCDRVKLSTVFSTVNLFSKVPHPAQIRFNTDADIFFAPVLVGDDRTRLIKEGSGTVVIRALLESDFASIEAREGTLQINSLSQLNLEINAKNIHVATGAVLRFRLVIDYNPRIMVHSPISGGGNVELHGDNYGNRLHLYNTDTFTGTITVNLGLLSIYSNSSGGVPTYNNGNVTNGVALNPNISCVAGGNQYFGRIAGQQVSGSLSNNIAFNNMLNPTEETIWSSSNINGSNITAQFINTDGMLGGRFTAANNWSVENGKLPGLFGVPVDMPEHLLYFPPPQITTLSLPNGVVGNLYDYELEVTSETPVTWEVGESSLGTAYNQTLSANGDSPITWSLEDGALPNGLNLYGNGIISGSPTAAGTFNFIIKATNSFGNNVKALTMIVNAPPVITTITLPDGTIGEAYSQSLVADGDTPITWTLEGGNLPNGLNLYGSGIISGSPTMKGLFNFIVKAANNFGSHTKELSIKIADVGIADITLPQIKIYPNPTSEQLIVEHGDAMHGVTDYCIYNVTGQLIMLGQLSCKDVRCRVSTINVETLSSGIYYLNISKQTVKFVKQ